MLKRGFKSQSERRAVELRRRMGLGDTAPLLGSDVAKDLDVTIWLTEDVAGLSTADLRQLRGAGAKEWSGFTLRIGIHNLIVVNSEQSARRQNSVVMHELAHIMLGHELASAVQTSDGHLVPSAFNQEQEDEAAWLGAALLLPRPALLWMRRMSMSDDDAATHFAVSPDLLRWRVRMTGIDYQLGLRSPRASARR